MLCAHCDWNDEDLLLIDGQPYCKACRTCPHDVVHGEDDLPCALCYRDYHTTWTFVGPIIINMEKYITEAEIDRFRLAVWTYKEEEQLCDGNYVLSVIRRPSLMSMILPPTTVMIKETGSSVLRASRKGPSPCPLIHHRRR